MRLFIHLLCIPLMAVAALFMIAGFLYDRSRRHRAVRLLRSREPLDSVTFARTCFAGPPDRASDVTKGSGAGLRV